MTIIDVPLQDDDEHVDVFDAGHHTAGVRSHKVSSSSFALNFLLINSFWRLLLQSNHTTSGAPCDPHARGDGGAPRDTGAVQVQSLPPASTLASSSIFIDTQPFEFK